MKELWIKKTIWRRYLIESYDEKDVRQIIKDNQNVPLGCMGADDLIANYWDKNKKIEYDNEEVILPIEFEIQNYETVKKVLENDKKT